MSGGESNRMMAGVPLSIVSTLSLSVMSSIIRRFVVGREPFPDRRVGIGMPTL